MEKRQSIAIVDDRLTNRKILERLARSLGEGVRVDTFDRPSALLAASAERPPDLVITDVKMPELDGVEFIRRFRSIAGCAEVPIVAVTTSEDRELRLAALEAGATDFLLSPVDHHEFRVRSRNLLMLRRQQLLLAARASSLEEQMIAEERRHRDALRAQPRAADMIVRMRPGQLIIMPPRWPFVLRSYLRHLDEKECLPLTRPPRGC